MDIVKKVLQFHDFSILEFLLQIDNKLKIA